MPPKVVVTRTPPGSAVERIANVADVTIWPHDRRIDRDVLLDWVTDADGLFSMLEDPIDRSLLESAPSLRVVSTMAVGVDNIDIDACRDLGIAVGHTPGVLTDSTADMAWALLLAATRRFPEAVEHVRSGAWAPWEPESLLGFDASRTTLGVLGMGRIGAAVARRSVGFDMTVLYASRSAVPDVERAVGAVRATMGEVLERSDHVVVCLPLTPDTRGLIGADAFASMKPTANLINVARGPIVDTEALYRALVSGQIRCAGLDVTDPEPLPAEHPLVALPNCLIVPHLGSATTRTRLAMADLAADNLIAGLSGRPMPARIV
jgi:glyoxylate reductase